MPLKPEHNRRNLTIAIIIAGLAFVILAISLRTAPAADPEAMQRLWAFLFGETNQGSMFGGTGTVDRPYGKWIVDIVRYFYYAALVSFPISLVLAMLDPEQRKRILRSTAFLIVLAAILFGFTQRQQEEEVELVDYPVGTLIPTEEPFVFEESGFEYEPVDSPAWITWSVTAIIAIGLSIAVGLMINRLRSRKPPTLPTEELTGTVQKALSAVERGADFNETILQCYVSMMHTVEAYRGLRKGDTVTASEFIASLLKAGLPDDAVNDLTKLFEQVRYGQHTSSPSDENRAIASLRSIALRLEEASHEQVA